MDNIDKRMAELMGWIIIDDLHVKNEHGEYVFDGTPWQPSQRIEQAWIIVEKLREEGFFVCIQGGDDITRNDWWVQIADEEGSVTTRAATAPMAICQAVLKTKGGEHEI